MKNKNLKRVDFRFRRFIRQGWTIVFVPALKNNSNHWDFSPFTFTSTDNKNFKHFQEMNEWCNKYIPHSAWKSTMYAPSGNPSPGLKRFAFKEPKYATLFSLKWL